MRVILGFQKQILKQQNLSRGAWAVPCNKFGSLRSKYNDRGEDRYMKNLPPKLIDTCQKLRGHKIWFTVTCCDCVYIIYTYFNVNMRTYNVNPPKQPCVLNQSELILFWLRFENYNF